MINYKKQKLNIQNTNKKVLNTFNHIKFGNNIIITHLQFEFHIFKIHSCISAWVAVLQPEWQIWQLTIFWQINLHCCQFVRDNFFIDKLESLNKTNQQWIASVGILKTYSRNLTPSLAIPSLVFRYPHKYLYVFSDCFFPGK